MSILHRYTFLAKSKMNKLHVLIPLLLVTTSLPAQDSRLLKALFDSSEVVIQGIIADAKCYGYSLGIDECSYKLKVDSIYKGNPDTHSADMLIGLDPGYSTSEPYEVIYFSRDCYSSETCPGRNQNVILFLKKNVNKNGYLLTDRWLGFQPYSLPMSTELGRLHGSNDKK
jgi:hypothetical protein